ncbi:Uu.00g023930.m01.CDS01 [Anthostomella pinea]|uniref:Uu.00g023930.m01.CDS01 n=1 Tax=Anthostomella pinea TaxID=933095 RepID=A0AAI8W043_9PEZI|nr:Uu.00g023930.m01.CDS01 [Anthostomella pinea]
MFNGQRLRQWLSGLPGHRVCSMKWQSLLRYAAITFAVTLTLSGVFLFRRPEGFLSGTTSHYFEYFWNRTETHPIEHLVSEAHLFHENLLKEQSFDVPAAAARYRARRGRHPPPGFDAWLAYAVEHDAIVVESYFDRIYADLAPFWGLDPQTIAERAASWEHVVQVRNGTVNPKGSTENRVPWLQLWSGLVAEAAPFLPDVDMPINYMDESRLAASWEDITSYVEIEQASRTVKPVEEVVTAFSGLDKVDARGTDTEPYQPEWLHSNYWDLMRVGCAPDSASRNATPMVNFTGPAEFPQDWSPNYAYDGFVRNFTASSDPCSQPHLRGMHGTFVEPLTLSTSKELIPLFSGCKLPMNNDILIPGAMYLTDDVMYSGGDTHGPAWRQKVDGTVWRGVASGGRHHAENWSHFQRLRLVEMLNSTTVSAVEASGSRAMTFEMPSAKLYDFPRRREGTIGKWLKKFSNVGVTMLLCHPAESECDYLLPHISGVEGVPMKEQYKYKFMPDVDGNSFSARFRGFLLSTSLPIKSTIYAEWHDDRLVPWLHFVPMDNTFQDLYAILDYFSYDKKGDRAAQFIAGEGSAWGNKVLRREDMLLYVWRLLLEFARVCDEKRELLGYVDDL